MNWQTIAYELFTDSFLLYSILLVICYVAISVLSIAEITNYRNKNSFTDYRILASSTELPSMSILAPAYNEGETIVENVRSLLSLHYNNLEVIIINDGSKDNSLKKLITTYDLYKVDYFVNEQIPTKPVKGVYKSRNPVYHKLIVVDKVNGGKADALNVGVNIAQNKYYVCIDVDCVLEQDAILKLAKPFLENTTKRVIAVGGVVRIANSCEIEGGRIVKVNLPTEFLPRMQTLEYIRAFLLGRMAWARLNGLLLISGAFGVFDKDIVIKCGGYNTATVGEDMELVVRMRRYMEERKQPYRVNFIPDPLCWTEAPASFKILGRQRNRWTRGTIETLRMHKKMFLNPNYGLLGMLSFPYWLFFEFLAPIIEFIGIIGLVICWVTGIISQSVILIMLSVFVIGILYSVFAILMEVLTYNQYKQNKDILRLLLMAVLEPIVYHPFIVWSAIKGNVDLLRKKNSWGEMTRQGFAPSKKTQAVEESYQEPVSIEDEEANKEFSLHERTPYAISKYHDDTLPYTFIWWLDKTRRENAGILQPYSNPDPVKPDTINILRTEIMEKKETKKNSFRERLAGAAVSFSAFSVVWLMVIFSLTLFELINNGVVHQFPANFAGIIAWAWLSDVIFWLNWLVCLFIIYMVVYLISGRLANTCYKVFIVLFALLQLGLTFYFTTSLVPLGADVYGYSWGDIKQTVGSSGGVSIFNILMVILVLAAATVSIYYLPKKIKLNRWTAFTILGLSLLVIFSGLSAKSFVPDLKSDFANNLVLNKTDYFLTGSQKLFFAGKEETDIYADSYISDYNRADKKNTTAFNYTDPDHYPFLHTDSVRDVLSPFFNIPSTRPNIVVVLVEGLGRAFTNNGAYLGNFTPFIDSLSGKSLYWKNFLSEGGRTFAALPSLMGSLPFAKNGFLELGQNMPEHLSLLNLLKHNGYHTSFYYGGDSQFDNMAMFLHKNEIDELNDEKSFPAGYTKLPPQNGFTWGYNDGELFRHFLTTRSDKAAAPQLSVILTVATHNPFVINDEAKYLQRFEERMTQLGFDDAKKNEHRNYKLQYASVLYLDDMLRTFFSNYSKRSDFGNTIFLITGDHRMPEIPMSDKIDRYHVPLIIYSPLLKKPAQFSSVSTHFDISPSLVAFLQHNFKMAGPSLVSWMGQGLDTNRSFRNIHSYPLMQTKTDLVDFVMGEYHINNDNLFKLNPELGEDPIRDEAKLNQLKNAFEQFKKRNAIIMSGNHIIPDTIYHHYTQSK